MNDRFFTMGIMLLFITIGVNTMITMGSTLQDTQGSELKIYLLPYINPGWSSESIKEQIATCSVNAEQLTPQATIPGSTEGFTPITCNDHGGVSIAAGLAFITNAVLMLAGLELILVAIGSFIFPAAYIIFFGLATIVAMIKWAFIAYAASQIVRAIFGRSLF